MFFFSKIVLLDDCFWDVLYWDGHVSITFHGCIQIEVFDVRCSKECIFGGEYAVQHDFGCGTLCSFGTDIARVINLIAANYKNLIHFVLSLFGQSAATMCKYVGFLSCGILDWWMKNIVSVPLILVLLFPCASWLTLSAVSMIHSAPSELLRRSLYSAGSLVSGWMA